MTFIIYKIRHCNYIGSTTNLRQRKWRHNTCLNYEKNPNHNLKLYKYLRANNIKIELIQLEIYHHKCSKKLQTLVEQYWINKFDSVNNGLNSINAFSSKEQTKEKRKKQRKVYREKNKEKLSKYKKEYTEKNRDEINKKGRIYYQETKEERHKYQKKYREKNKEKIKERFNKNKKKYNKNRNIKVECCICKRMITKCNLKRHQKTKSCKSFI